MLTPSVRGRAPASEGRFTRPSLPAVLADPLRYAIPARSVASKSVRGIGPTHGVLAPAAR